MHKKSPLFTLSALLIGMLALACNTKDGTRFNEQEELYSFVSNTLRIKAHGANRIEEIERNTPFRCPSASGMGRDSEVMLFSAAVNAPYPHFEIDTDFGVRSDNADAVGFSLTHLPLDLLDIYEVCSALTTEKYLTQCPADYTLVESCNNEPNTCARIQEGTHQLVLTSMTHNDKRCYSEEGDRTLYSESAPNIAFACDEFDHMPVLAAYRGNIPNNLCCQEEDTHFLDLCIRPCGCRKLTINLQPKEPFFEDRNNEDTLKLAVFSNIEGDNSSYESLLASLKKEQVDMAINLGNMTQSGGMKEWRRTFERLVQHSWHIDGLECSDGQAQVCCEQETQRQYPFLCHAVTEKLPFISSVGENELSEKSLSAFYRYFGPTNTSTFIGKTQIVLLDTAEAAISSPQWQWLSDVLYTHKTQVCNIPNPHKQGFEQWPLLKECTDKGKRNCSECIETEAVCITPHKEQSMSQYGPQNCVCVPNNAKFCRNNHYCKAETGTDSVCLCSRDEDCGLGGTCGEDGKCIDPLRLIFSYTPLFDNFGARGSAFRSKTQAAELLAKLLDSQVYAIFSGKILDYQSFSMANIKMYITGAASQKAEALSKHKRHYLLVHIPHAWTDPHAQDIHVEIRYF